LLYSRAIGSGTTAGFTILIGKLPGLLSDTA